MPTAPEPEPEPEVAPNESSVPTAGFRTGLVALIGRTNVGKSSLLNALVASKISIVSPKPQTTRHAIQGVVHRPEAQLVFVDTPGFFQTRRSALVEALHARAREALEGIDVVVHVVDPSRPIGPEETLAAEALASTQLPRVLCLNKSDLPQRPHRSAWLARARDYAATVELSALAGRDVNALVNALIPFLPEGPPLFPPGELTNATKAFRIGEVIREKIYLQTEEEVPYRTAVRVNRVEERPRPNASPTTAPLLLVEADLLVAEERYKGMLIGAQGARVNQIKNHARRELEQILGQRIRLKINVQVDRSLP